MPLKIIYLIVRLAAALAVLVFRRDLAREAELLVPRHENAVLPLGDWETRSPGSASRHVARAAPQRRDLCGGS